MTLALHAEWTKLRTVRGNAWLLLACVLLTIAVSGMSAAGTSYLEEGAAQDAMETGLLGVRLGQAAFAVLAVTIISGEYSTGMILGSLAAVPGRWTLLAAKAVLVAGVVLLAATVAVLVSVAIAAAVLPGNGFTAANGFPSWSPTSGPLLRVASGSVIYLVLIALLALGVATAVRDTAAAVGLVLALLYLFPLLATLVTDDTWERRLEQLGPMTAGLAVQTTRNVDALAIGPSAGVGVLSAWAAAALLGGGLTLRMRDA
jgi:ABC-2 type transport system permease protein